MGQIDGERERERERERIFMKPLWMQGEEGWRRNHLPALAYSKSKSTKGGGQFNVPIRRTNRYQWYICLSQVYFGPEAHPSLLIIITGRHYKCISCRIEPRSAESEAMTLFQRHRCGKVLIFIRAIYWIHDYFQQNGYCRPISRELYEYNSRISVIWGQPFKPREIGVYIGNISVRNRIRLDEHGTTN